MDRKFNMRVQVTTMRQLIEALNMNKFEYIYAPLALINSGTPKKEKIIAVPPVYMADNEIITKRRLSEIKEYGITQALAHTIGHVESIKSIGLKVFGGFRLNITNSMAQKFYEEQGLCDTTLSIELTIRQARNIRHTIPTGIVAYGRLPLMTTRRCPISDGKVCGGSEICTKKIIDRRGCELQLNCENVVEILNPDILILSDKGEDLQDFDFITMRLSENDDLHRLVESYEKGEKPENGFTRGLYYRGVIS